MKNAGSILMGLVGLGVLDAIVSRSSATQNVGGVIAGLGKAVRWFVSPAVPCFANASSTTSGTSSALLQAEQIPPATTPPPVLTPTFPGTNEPESPQTQAQGGAV